MNKITCFNTLRKALTTEISLTDKLLALLKTESKLSPKDSEALLMMSEDKNKLIHEIERHYNRRITYIQNLGFTPDHQGTQSCISKCDRNNELSLAWKLFMQKVKDCRQVNQINGSTLDSSLRVVKQALSILYGEQVNENTYDASGHSKSSSIGRSIAKA